MAIPDEAMGSRIHVAQGTPAATAEQHEQGGIPGLTEGRIVHFVLDSGPNAGHHRAAIVTRVWDKQAGTVNLLVFPDGELDLPAGPVAGAGEVHTMRVTSVPHSADSHFRSWHFIERA